MNRGTHTYLGGCSAVTIAALYPSQLTIENITVLPMLAIPFAISSAWFLDIDVKTSNARKAWKRLSIIMAVPAFLLIILLLADYTGKISIPILNSMISFLVPIIVVVFLNLLLAMELKHRTYSHSMYIPIPPVLLMDVTTRYMAQLATSLNTIIFGIVIGLSSHLFSDACTKKGIWLAYPIPIRIRLLPSFLAVTTGTKGETVFSAIFTIVCIAIVGFKYFWR